MAGGGATDGGNAENNSFDDPEWQILEVELIEVGCTLEGELQQIESLAVENNKKVEELHDLEEDVKTLQERNGYDVTMLQEEHTSASQELSHKLCVLHEQLAQLSLKHDRYNELATLSDEAGMEVEHLLAGMERRTKTHAEEVHKTRREVLHLRQGLEATFRTTLKDLEGTYRRKAFKALSGDAKAGMRNNKVLRDELAVQNTGVAALCERHVKQKENTGQFSLELKGLRRLKERHNEALAALHRETRTNHDVRADVKETREKIQAAELCLKSKLEEEGIPVCSLEEIRAMTSKEIGVAESLERFKRVWKGRARDVMRCVLDVSSDQHLSTPSTSGKESVSQKLGSGINSGVDCVGQTLTGIKSSQSCEHFGKSHAEQVDFFHVHAKKASPPSWRARVERVVANWADSGSHNSSESSRRDVLNSLSANRSAREIAPKSAPLTQGRAGTLEEARSASLPSLLQTPYRALQTHNSTTVEPHANARDPPPGGSRSEGARKVVGEEDPWKRKVRMERVFRRKDATLRARGLPVNSGRLTSSQGQQV